MTQNNTSQYVLPSVYLMPAIGVCADKMIDLKRILMLAGLSPNVLQSPHNIIDYIAFIKVLNEGARASGDDLFGFLVGRELSATNVGVIGQLIAAQTCIANIYPAINYLFNTQNRGAHHNLIVAGEKAYHNVTYLVEDEINCDQVSQLTLTGYFNVFKQTLGDAWYPTRVLLKNPKSIDTNRMQIHYDCPIVTGADKNAIEFPAHLIYQETERTDVNSRESKAELARVLLECDELDRLVGNYLEFSLAEGKFDKSTIAKRLGVHPRVLQNCLHTRNLEYKEILKSVRKEKACKLLKDSDIAVADIALQLGYSESRVFTRAFKGWTGVTPLKWRAGARS